MDIRRTQALKDLSAQAAGLFAGREDSLCREAGISTEPAGWVTTSSRPKQPSSAVHGRPSSASASSAGRRSASSLHSIDHQKTTNDHHRPASAIAHKKDGRRASASLSRTSSHAISVDEHGDDDHSLSENASRRSSKTNSLATRLMSKISAAKHLKDGINDFDTEKVGPCGLLMAVQSDENMSADWLHFLISQPEVDVNAVNSAFGWSSLHFLANTGKARLSKRLIDASGVVTSTCKQGNTALHLAARGGHLEAVELLIEKKSKVNAKNSNGWTALTWSAINGHEEVVLALLRVAAHVDTSDLQGRTAAMWAARHGFVEIVHDLLHANVSLPIRDKHGFTLADHAQDQVELRSLLLKIEAMNSCLLDSSKQNNVESASQALASGAHVNVEDELGWNSLRWALMHESVDMTRLLVKHGARLSDPELNPSMPLDLKHLQLLDRTNLAEELALLLGSSDRILAAARNQEWDNVTKELQNGAFVNTKDDDFRTVLMFAAAYGDEDAISLLIDSHAKLHERDRHGWAAIHYAVNNGGVEAVAVLYYLGANLSTTTHDGSHLQHIAARCGHGSVLEMLLVARADLEVQNMDGDTPLQVSARTGSMSVCNVLLSYGADSLTKDPLSRIPLATAAIGGHLQVVQAMLQPIKAPPRVVSEEQLEVLYESMEHHEYEAWARFAGISDFDDTASVISHVSCSSKRSRSSSKSSLHAVPRSKGGSVRSSSKKATFALSMEQVGEGADSAADGRKSPANASERSTSPRASHPDGHTGTDGISKSPSATGNTATRLKPPHMNHLCIDEEKHLENGARSPRSSQGSARTAVLALKVNVPEHHGHGEKKHSLGSKSSSKHSHKHSLGSSDTGVSEHLEEHGVVAKKVHSHNTSKHSLGSNDTGVSEHVEDRRVAAKKAHSHKTSKHSLGSDDTGVSEHVEDRGVGAKKVHSHNTSKHSLGSNDTGVSGTTRLHRSSSISGASEASVESSHRQSSSKKNSLPEQPSLGRSVTSPSRLSASSSLSDASSVSRSKSESLSSRVNKVSLAKTSINKMSLAKTKIPEEDEDRWKNQRSRTRFGKYTLILLSWHHHDHIVSHMATAKAPKLLLESADVDGCCPLALAAREGQAEIIPTLLNRKAVVDALDMKGNTALILAAAENDRFSVERLLIAEPKVSLQNKAKKSALDVTTSIAIKRLLERKVVKTKTPNSGILSASSEKKDRAFVFRLEGLPPLGSELLEGHIRALLRRLNAADPVRVDVVIDPFTGSPLGYARVEYDSAEKAYNLRSGPGDTLCDTTVRIIEEEPCRSPRPK